MSRPRKVIPAYSLHRPTGQARVRINGRDYYLGVHGSSESQRAYADLLDRWQRGTLDDRPAKSAPATGHAVTVNELFAAFVTRELPRFSRSEQDNFRTAVRVVRPLFGETLVADFGPNRFRLMRDAMVAGDATVGRIPWTRNVCNRQAKRIRAIFRWGVSHELVPVEVLQRLDTVRSLAIGETTARETKPREAVPEEHLDAVRAELSPKYRDLLDLMLLTGSRPGELLKLTRDMLQERGDVWLAELADHKTARKGKRRFLVFNPAAQDILRRHFPKKTDALIFPWRRDNFTPAIKRACLRAGVPPFCPHQLRHTAAARLVDTVGLEVAQAVLGHSDAAMTRHYARSSELKAIEGAKRLG